MKICVLGLGYIGLPTASMFATQGVEVIGVDVNPRVVTALTNGDVHIKEPGLHALVESALQSGKFHIATEPSDADAFIIAVPTPSKNTPDSGDEVGTSSSRGRRPDLSYVKAAAEAVAACLKIGNLVILESTSPPGTTAHVVREILEKTGLIAGSDFSLAFCAERVLPGRILIELVDNDRIVGGVDAASAERARELYATFVQGSILTTDTTTAEMVKLMENTFRDVNIALANEFAKVCEVVGIDVYEATRLANHHPRVDILKPGPGVGGHCIAVDPWFVVSAAPEVTQLIRSARDVNDAQPQLVADMIGASVVGIKDPVITALGLAYKADIDDLRESPSIEVVKALRRSGFSVRLHDPFSACLPDGTPVEQDLNKALAGADVCVILTDHSPYRQLKPWDSALTGMRHKQIVDTRDCLEYGLWESAGFIVRRLGVASKSTIQESVSPGVAEPVH